MRLCKVYTKTPPLGGGEGGSSIDIVVMFNLYP